MVSVSLLVRLERDMGTMVNASGSATDSAVMDSVLGNLREILNSRQNCCETRPDYGFPDLMATKDLRGSMHLIAREVEKQIRMFEPRLRNVLVRPVDDKARLAELIFHISGELAYEGRTVRIVFDSVVGSDGHVRLNA